MNRRSFIGSLVAGMVAPVFLPGAGRKWKQTESGMIAVHYEIITNLGTLIQFGFTMSSDPPPLRFVTREGEIQLTGHEQQSLT